MVNISINISTEDNVKSSIEQQIREIVKDIDLSSFGIRNYSIMMEKNLDEESLSQALHISPSQQLYLLFQNRPKYLIHNTSFDAELSRFGLRLRSLEIPSSINAQNILLVFDFGQESDNSILETHAESIKQKEGMFVPIDPKYNMSQVVLSDEMKTDIFDAISIIQNQELIYKEWGFEEVDPNVRSVINFYGPPGTGKTKCAHAVAHELGKQILCLNYSDIESMWVGESPKNLVAAFNAAERKEAVLFMDEADSFLGKRITNVQSGHDQSINSLRSQLLILLENFKGIVIFGTNLVKNFDKAFETRIVKHIKFDLPDAHACSELYKILIPSKIPQMTVFIEEDYNYLGELSVGLSGRDIRNVILETLSFAANHHIQAFTRDMFESTIKNKKDEYQKLKERDTAKEREVEDAVVSSLIAESAKKKREALKAIYHYLLNELHVEESKQKIISEEISGLMGEDLSQCSIEGSLSLQAACAIVSAPADRKIAMMLIIAIISNVDVISETNWATIQKIYCLLDYSMMHYEQMKSSIQSFKEIL